MIDNSKIDALIHWDDTYSDSLRHWGIKGQKHGQRRFQNKDGSLTPLGRIRYGVGKAGEKIKDIRESKKASKAQKKQASRSVKDLTDDELKARIARLTAEKNALDLERQISSLSPKKVSSGREFMSSVGDKVIKPAILEAGKDVLTKYLKTKGFDLAGLGEVKDFASELKKQADISKHKRDISDNERKIMENDLWREKQKGKQSDNAQSGGKKKKNEADSSSTKPKDDNSNTSSEDAKTKSSETSTKQSTVVDAGKRQVESSINASRELNDLYSHYNRRAESAMDAMYSSGFMMTPVSML